MERTQNEHNQTHSASTAEPSEQVPFHHAESQVAAVLHLVTMVNTSLEKTYDLSIDVINAFGSWNFR